jgi:hypothetical protein
MTIVITPRPPIAAAARHMYATAVVRELPPVHRPGTFDSTW